MISNTVMETLTRGGVLPVVRLPSLDRAARLAQTLLDAGVTAFEVTLTSPGALEALKAVRAKFSQFESGEAVIGAGSVVSAEQAGQAIDAGAQFIVTPVTYPDTIAACVRREVPIVPGAMTPTEVQSAWDMGASAVKVFPAHHFGPVYLKDLLAPLPHLKLVPTGGVNLDNAADYIRHGAVALGVGSSLVNAKRIEAEDWAGLAADARAFLEAVKAGRAKA
jgi:2-dehydro-3-deoxyphosphogluconate aldolase / (4S)-4-hydroxy-2-oxoglutarate aldolase